MQKLMNMYHMKFKNEQDHIHVKGIAQRWRYYVNIRERHHKISPSVIQLLCLQVELNTHQVHIYVSIVNLNSENDLSELYSYFILDLAKLRITVNTVEISSTPVHISVHQ